MDQYKNKDMSSTPTTSTIIDPYMATFVAMDDISRKITNLLEQNNQLVTQYKENNLYNLQSINQNKENTLSLLNQLTENHKQLLKESKEDNLLLLKQAKDANIQLLKNIVKINNDAEKRYQITEKKYQDTEKKYQDTENRYTQIMEVFNKLLDISYNNQKLLVSILGELKAGADEGEFLRRDGTVTTTQFTILNAMSNPGHPVKAYTVRNDGPNTIYVAHNAAYSSTLDADTIDVTSNTSRFEEILANEDIKFVFNRNAVRSVHILAKDGDSQFRAWLTW